MNIWLDQYLPKFDGIPREALYKVDVILICDQRVTTHM